MTKTNRFLSLALLLLVATLATTSLVSGTLAKYVTELGATGTLTVAKWAVKFGGGTAAESATFAITHSDTDTQSDRVAPGTSGSFNLSYTTKGSEVKHSVSITLNNANLGEDVPNLKFYSDEDLSTEIELGKPMTFTHGIGGTTDYVTVPVYWDWQFETSSIAVNDPIDTEAGEAGTEYILTAELVAVQLND